MIGNLVIRIFYGEEVAPYLPLIAKLRLDYGGGDKILSSELYENEIENLCHHMAQEGALYVLALDGSQLIGAAIGAPLGADYPDYFCIEAPTIIPKYRGLGLDHHFYDQFETIIESHHQFSFICLKERSADEIDHTNLHTFLHRRGYIKHPLPHSILWTLSLKKSAGV